MLGSAQARRATSVLQHGSLPLTGDLTRVVDCLTFDDEAERETLRRVAARPRRDGRGTGRPVVSYDEAVAAMIAGIVEALELELAPGELTDQEREWTSQLARDKYKHDSWTMRA